MRWQDSEEEPVSARGPFVRHTSLQQERRRVEECPIAGHMQAVCAAAVSPARFTVQLLQRHRLTAAVGRLDPPIKETGWQAHLIEAPQWPPHRRHIEAPAGASPILTVLALIPTVVALIPMVAARPACPVVVAEGEEAEAAVAVAVEVTDSPGHVPVPAACILSIWNLAGC